MLNIVEFIEHITECSDKGNLVEVSYLKHSKVLDKVPYNMLI